MDYCNWYIKYEIMPNAEAGFMVNAMYVWMDPKRFGLVHADNIEITVPGDILQIEKIK